MNHLNKQQAVDIICETEKHEKNDNLISMQYILFTGVEVINFNEHAGLLQATFILLT